MLAIDDTERRRANDDAESSEERGYSSSERAQPRPAHDSPPRSTQRLTTRRA
jgi:hypothetical protein